MHPEGVEDKWSALVTCAQDVCRYIRKQMHESDLAFIVMCAAFLLMMSINIFALRLMRMSQEVHRLFNTALDDNPKESQSLLELNYSTQYNTPYERQAHWAMAIYAVWQAGWRTASQERTRGGLQQRQAAKLAARGIYYNFSTLTTQTRHGLGLEAPTRHRPHPTSTLATKAQLLQRLIV